MMPLSLAIFAFRIGAISAIDVLSIWKLRTADLQITAASLPLWWPAFRRLVRAELARDRGQ
jgi:hypothetical protein